MEVRDRETGNKTERQRLDFLTLLAGSRAEHAEFRRVFRGTRPRGYYSRSRPSTEARRPPMRHDSKSREAAFEGSFSWRFVGDRKTRALNFEFHGNAGEPLIIRPGSEQLFSLFHSGTRGRRRIVPLKHVQPGKFFERFSICFEAMRASLCRGAVFRRQKLIRFA